MPRNPFKLFPEWLRTAFQTTEPLIPNSLEVGGILPVTDALRPGNNGQRIRAVQVSSLVGPIAAGSLYWNTKGNSSTGPVGDNDALNYQALCWISTQNAAGGAAAFISWWRWWVADAVATQIKGLTTAANSLQGQLDWAGNSDAIHLRPGCELRFDYPALAAGTSLIVNIAQAIYPATQVLDR